VIRRSIAALALLMALGCADAAAAAERCKLPRGADQLAASSYARVYSTVDVEGFPAPAYACSRRTGRRFRLDNPDLGVRVLTPQVAGPHVAYELQNYEGEAVFYSLYRLNVLEARRHALGFWSEEDDEILWSFQLVKSGALAWSEITGRGQTGEVWLHGAAGRQRLDSGPPELAMSFAVSDNRKRIYWTSGGEPRTAPLR
jgi:hypothetical protein